MVGKRDSIARPTRDSATIAGHRAICNASPIGAWCNGFARASRNLPSRLAGGASRDGQFALLNRVRNTDNFFVGGKKKNPSNFLPTATFKGKVALPNINGSLYPHHQGRG